jgi:hypothetical protein
MAFPPWKTKAEWWLNGGLNQGAGDVGPGSDPGPEIKGLRLLSNVSSEVDVPLPMWSYH